VSPADHQRSSADSKTDVGLAPIQGDGHHNRLLAVGYISTDYSRDFIVSVDLLSRCDPANPNASVVDRGSRCLLH
jgi:hypothetical protein